VRLRVQRVENIVEGKGQGLSCVDAKCHSWEEGQYAKKKKNEEMKREE